MKFIKLIFTIFFIFLTIMNSNSQGCNWCYSEQISGVTSNLTSVSVVGNFVTSQVWICGDNGVVLKTTNQGSNWVNAGGSAIPANVNLVSITCNANDTVLTAGNIGTTTYVYRTVNGGINWTQVFSQTNGKINAVWMRNGTQAFMSGDPVGGRWSLWKSSNGGLAWDSSGIYLPQAGSETGFNNSLAFVYNFIWFGTNNSRIYKSTNNGLNWSAMSTAPEINSTSVWMHLDTSYAVFGYFGGSNLHYTSNGGVNWSLSTCPDTGNFVGFNYEWFGVSLNAPSGSYAVRRSNKIYSGNYSYFLAEYTAPSGIYNHMAYNQYYQYWMGANYTWAVRSNGGITRISLFRGGAVHSISSKIPESFKLEQNYPNPFNPTTNIRFNLPKTEFVTIKIFDELGREVSTIVKEQLHAGEYETSFDASSFASGIYFYSLITPDFVQTKKMILVK